MFDSKPVPPPQRVQAAASVRPSAVSPQAALMGDVWGGLAAMLVALPSSIAFGVLAYSTLGPEYASMGAMAARSALRPENSSKARTAW